MATQVAHAAARDLSGMQNPIGPAAPQQQLPGQTPGAYDTDPALNNGLSGAARRIVTAMIIAAPFWLLIGLTVYLLT